MGLTDTAISRFLGRTGKADQPTPKRIYGILPTKKKKNPAKPYRTRPRSRPSTQSAGAVPRRREQQSGPAPRHGEGNPALYRSRRRIPVRAHPISPSDFCWWWCEQQLDDKELELERERKQKKEQKVIIPAEIRVGFFCEFHSFSCWCLFRRVLVLGSQFPRIGCLAICGFCRC
jgi:hypothetical protein